MKHENRGARSDTDPSTLTDRRVRVVRGVAVAISVTVVVRTVLLEVGLGGPVVLGLAALVFLALPIASSLSARICLFACISAGVVPMLWSWPGLAEGMIWWSVPLACGISGYRIGSAGSVKVAARTAVPKIHRTDLLPLLVCVISAFLMRRELSVATPSDALVKLLPSWDGAAHFNMAAVLLREGVMIDRLPAAPDGYEWAFGHYPQGYHALVATLMRALGGRGTPIPDLLPLFVRANAILVIVGLTVVAAAICMVPALRHRPVLVIPAVALVFSAYGLGPGLLILLSGFHGFWLACVLVASVMAISLTAPHAFSSAHVAANAGALVGIAFMWAPLLILAAPAILLMAFPESRRRCVGSTREVVLACLFWSVAAALLVRAWRIIATSGASAAVLNADGGISPPNLVSAMLAVGIAAFACLMVYLRNARMSSQARNLIRGVAHLAFVPAVGCLSLSTLALFQLGSIGGLSYYFFKYLSAVELVSWFAAAVASATLVASATRSERFSASAIGGVTAVSIAVVHAFSSAIYWNNLPSGPPLSAETGFDVPSFRRVAVQLLGAAESQPTDWSTNRRVFLAMPPSVLPTQLRNQWYCALTGTWTSRISELELPQDRELRTPLTGRAAVKEFLANNPDIHAVVVSKSTSPRPEEVSLIGVAGSSR